MTPDEITAIIATAREWPNDPGAPMPGTDPTDDAASRFACCLLHLAAENERMRVVVKAACQSSDLALDKGASLKQSALAMHLMDQAVANYRAQVKP